MKFESLYRLSAEMDVDLSTSHKSRLFCVEYQEAIYEVLKQLHLKEL